MVIAESNVMPRFFTFGDGSYYFGANLKVDIRESIQIGESMSQ